jgi:hypothetical protein
MIDDEALVVVDHEKHQQVEHAEQNGGPILKTGFARLTNRLTSRDSALPDYDNRHIFMRHQV